MELWHDTTREHSILVEEVAKGMGDFHRSVDAPHSVRRWLYISFRLVGWMDGWCTVYSNVDVVRLEQLNQGVGVVISMFAISLFTSNM